MSSPGPPLPQSRSTAAGPTRGRPSRRGPIKPRFGLGSKRPEGSAWGAPCRTGGPLKRAPPCARRTQEAEKLSDWAGRKKPRPRRARMLCGEAGGMFWTLPQRQPRPLPGETNRCSALISTLANRKKETGRVGGSVHCRREGAANGLRAQGSGDGAWAAGRRAERVVTQLPPCVAAAREWRGWFGPGRAGPGRAALLFSLRR